ncbi:MAG: hypothetical protein M0P71_12345 [Melioribacteraceae bacterium]|jgi:hypothetical protein|nr:hypothetical protein [Melioribacteraceae bacterium]
MYKNFKRIDYQKFKMNDVVRCDNHNRLMIVDKYYFVKDKGISTKGTGNKIVVTEGGYYTDNELTLVYRK